MNYEEMSDFEINSLVIRILLRGQLIDYHEQEVNELLEVVGFDGASSVVRFTTGLGNEQQFDGCNNPSDAWSIIVENKITICPDVYIGGWYGQKDIDRGMDGDSIHVTKDKNPLRAAMICFLKMKDSENEK